MRNEFDNDASLLLHWHEVIVKEKLMKRFLMFLVIAGVLGFWSLGCKEKKSKSGGGTPLSIVTTTVNNAYEGQTNYSATLQATGGTGTYTWSLVQGSLPSNLNLSSSGVISGDLAAGTAGTYNFTVQVDDGSTQAQKQFTMNVYSGLSVTTNSLPDATEGQQYSP